jgi:hypothetical protein
VEPPQGSADRSASRQRSPAAATPGPGASSTIDPANFCPIVGNPWFPLVPGTTLTYKGTKDDKPSIDTFEITRETAVIDGVTCVVIHDTLAQGGKVAEQTVDWYAQDRAGNVWYFVEDTKTLDANGKVTGSEGTWQAGVPYGPFPDALTTAEWTPLEPDVLSEKAHVKGTGEVKEFDVAGSNEGFQLVGVTKP